MRSAYPPTTSAGVMIAKVIWNIRNTDSGTVGAAAAVDAGVTPERNILPLPRKAL